jgi:hypothetical protein
MILMLEGRPGEAEEAGALLDEDAYERWLEDARPQEANEESWPASPRRPSQPKIRATGEG